MWRLDQDTAGVLKVQDLVEQLDWDAAGVLKVQELVNPS